MSEHPRSDDEILSSHLDGELTDEEGTRLDERLTSEPALRDRLAAIGAAQNLAGLPVSSLASADAERMITAAVAAGSTASNVTDLAAVASRRRVWPSRIAGIAATVVALALVGPALRAIDGGDDNDSAGVADNAEEAFDGVFDDDRDDTAADMATEAATLGEVPSAPLADSVAGATADDGDTNAGDTEEAPADAAGAQPLPYDTASLALFADNAGFDPLVDDLGGFDTTTALSTDVSEAWATYRSTSEPSTTTTTTPVTSADDSSAFFDAEVFRSEAYKRFDSLTNAPCATVVDVIVDHFAGETVVAADYASATVGDAPVTVGAFLRPDGSAELLVIVQATCDIRSAPLG